jgi:hypothetical protein
MDSDTVVLVDCTAVEELPLVIAVMDGKQNGKLAAMNRAAQIRELPRLASGTSGS